MASLHGLLVLFASRLFLLHLRSKRTSEPAPRRSRGPGTAPTCPTTCFPLMKASNPQTAAESLSGNANLASMGTGRSLVYFWKTMT